MEFSSGYWHYFHYSDSRGYLILCCHERFLLPGVSVLRRMDGICPLGGFFRAAVRGIQAAVQEGDGPEFMERHGSLFPSERVDFGFRRSFLLFIERFIDDLKFLL